MARTAPCWAGNEPDTAGDTGRRGSCRLLSSRVCHGRVRRSIVAVAHLRSCTQLAGRDRQRHRRGSGSKQVAAANPTGWPPQAAAVISVQTNLPVLNSTGNMNVGAHSRTRTSLHQQGKAERAGGELAPKSFVVVRGTPVAPEISKLYMPTPMCKPDKCVGPLTAEPQGNAAASKSEVREVGARMSNGSMPDQRLVPGDSIPAGRTLRWDEALRLLEHQTSVNRPSRLRLMPRSDQQLLFLERPMQKRKEIDDQWVIAGGRRGPTVECWMGDVGIRKRNGRVTCKGPGELSPLKFALYTRVRRPSGAVNGTDEAAQTIEDKCAALFVVAPSMPYSSRSCRSTIAGATAAHDFVAAISEAKRATAPVEAQPLPAEKKRKKCSDTESMTRNQVPCVLSMTQLKPMLKARGIAPRGSKNEWLARLAKASPSEFGKYFD